MARQAVTESLKICRFFSSLLGCGRSTLTAKVQVMVVKSNLEVTYFYEEDGSNDQMVDLLNCQRFALYCHLKKEGSLINPYIVFFEPLSLSVSLTDSGQIIGVSADAAPNQIFQNLFNVSSVRGNTRLDSQKSMENVLDNGELVILDTAVEFSPYSLFQAIDGNEVKGLPLYGNHVYLIVGHDDSHFFYVDATYVVDQKYFCPHPRNSSIGMAKKSEMIPAFDKRLNYATVDTDFSLYKELEISEEYFLEKIQGLTCGLLNESKNNYVFGLERSIPLIIDLLGSLTTTTRQGEKMDNRLLHDFYWSLMEIKNSRYLLIESIRNHRSDSIERIFSQTLILLEYSVMQWNALTNLVNPLSQANNIVELVDRLISNLTLIRKLESQLVNQAEEDIERFKSL